MSACVNTRMDKNTKSPPLQGNEIVSCVIVQLLWPAEYEWRLKTINCCVQQIAFPVPGSVRGMAVEIFVTVFDESDDRLMTVSYTHLTLPTTRMV